MSLSSIRPLSSARRTSHATLALAGLALALATSAGCTVRMTPPGEDTGAGRRDAGPTSDAGPDAPRLDANLDAPIVLDPDAACAAMEIVPAAVVRPPVDIIWVVDNSNSMATPISEVRMGMNDFAATLLRSGLDYRMILLSLRSARSGRLPICIDPPLAGPGCADGERFFQIDVDIRSAQPIEQLLGTLAQSSGYAEGAGDGGPPWRHLLRDGAHKTIVVVTDDNQRTCARPTGGSSCTPGHPPLTDISLEDYPGGLHPFSPAGTTRTIGPGILTAAYGDLFADYTFDAIYGWGSETDPDATCTYGDGSSPPSPGYTYSTLVARTGGVRAQLCSDSAAWASFFDEVAGGVVMAAPIACEIAVPPPPDGMFLVPGLVNVDVRGASGTTRLGYVADAAACDATLGGWYYDDVASPATILLCPASCTFARGVVVDAATSGIDVAFGCDSVPI